MTLKLGETVRLKSGGPVMTVVSNTAGGNGNGISVEWFSKTDAEKPSVWVFKAEALEVVPENKINK